MNFFLGSIFILLLAVASCTSKQNSNTPLNSTQVVDVLNPSNIDTTANPGVSFFQYSAGGWLKANPIPDEYSRYGVDTKLYETNILQIKNLIVNLGANKQVAGSNAQKIGDLYNICIDSAKRNREGADPIRSDLAVIDAIKNKKDLVRVSGALSHFINADLFFGVSVNTDDKNSDEEIVTLSQPQLGMGDRDYYLNADSKLLRQGYVQLMVRQFMNAGFEHTYAENAAKNVMKIETQLAQANATKEDLRTPELNYHKMEVKDLDTKVAKYEWNILFEALGLKNFKEVNVGQIKPIQAAIKLVQVVPLDQLKQYLQWSVINSAATELSETFYNDNFDFYGKQMSGRKVAKPLWKRAVSSVESAMGEAVGEMYVQKYFPPASKVRMLDLVKNLRVALGERIQNSKWMSDSTKLKAKEKLGSFIVKIGYPDKFRDYSLLVIKDDSYYANMKRASEFEYNRMVNKLGKPVDRTEWGMTPQEVNAYYEPNTNEICFPAGILQPPFFYPNADDAVNYGAIGAVIGHEMTHGFDDEGSQYDKDGNMKNWWTAKDAKEFKSRTKVLSDYFSGIVVVDTLHANGAYTLGENIADQGGLQVAYTAYMHTKEAKENKSIGGFTPVQRFFLSYGFSWAENINAKSIIQQTKSDPHALCKWRVDGALPQIDAWYTAFNITKHDPLYLPKEKRVDIW